ncbi:MAG TPA: helix-turn-helix domain-containing protein [Verrucomicrobiae bacterium]|nr:helix-turn-helix domain-containing protein [Verrucomicrobiae bacterium]
MKTQAVSVHHQPPEVRHRIFGERDADLPVGGIDVLMHRHVALREWALRQARDSCWRLYWPLSRGGEIIHNGQRTVLLPGYLYLIPPHTSFDSETARTLSKWYIHFTLRGGPPVLAPIRYLIELRLNHCFRLLRHSSLTIEEIAEQCGFANRFYLTRVMREYRQTTPAAFRRQARRRGIGVDS